MRKVVWERAPQTRGHSEPRCRGGCSEPQPASLTPASGMLKAHRGIMTCNYGPNPESLDLVPSLIEERAWASLKNGHSFTVTALQALIVS